MDSDVVIGWVSSDGSTYFHVSQLQSIQRRRTILEIVHACMAAMIACSYAHAITVCSLEKDRYAFAMATPPIDPSHD